MNNRRSESPLLEVRNLHVEFPIKSKLLQRQTGAIQAVSGVSFNISKGETLGLVGESGSGKSTIARGILGLEAIAKGDVLFEGEAISDFSPRRMRAVRRDIQLVFQDPFASLNPRRTVQQLITEPWQIHSNVYPESRWRQEAGDLLEHVGLNPDHADRYPHQFSGGQRQRIGIARALALRPKLLICDEPVSALDVSIQAQVLNLLADLQAEFDLTFLFIAHDISVVRHVSDRIAVMYLGKIVEIGDQTEVCDRPAHPYTQALLSAVPVVRPWTLPERHRIVLEGDVPTPASPPSGCRFRTRCWKAEPQCATEEPVLEVRVGEQESACHFAEIDRRVASE